MAWLAVVACRPASNDTSVEPAAADDRPLAVAEATEVIVPPPRAADPEPAALRASDGSTETDERERLASPHDDSPRTAGPREPNPYIAPLLRREGDLTVEAPPRAPSDRVGGRLRTHVEGSLSKGSPRVWVGPQVPGFVPLMEGSTELFLLDRVGDEFLALYRDPYGASSCELGTDLNCHYVARLYDIEGTVRWELRLHELMSAPRYLELQDIRYADGTLYFNEACQSYSSTVKGKCSALVAVDPEKSTVVWRTRSLVSNGEFLVKGDYIVTGYGFTDERDFLFVVRRRDGKIMHKVPVPKSAERFEIAEDGLLEVTVYPGTVRLYAMKGWEGASPKLVLTKRSGGGIRTGR